MHVKGYWEGAILSLSITATISSVFTWHCTKCFTYVDSLKQGLAWWPCIPLHWADEIKVVFKWLIEKNGKFKSNWIGYVIKKFASIDNEIPDTSQRKSEEQNNARYAKVCENLQILKKKKRLC